MRSIRLVLLVLAALVPALASARAWKGITPGATTQAQVMEKLGEPTKKTKREGQTVLAYYGEQALEGANQAHFHVDGQGVVTAITVFVSAQLDAESIEGTYGKPPKRTFSEDTFEKVWVYPADGITVYFAKDGNVKALRFGAGTKGPAHPPAAERAPAGDAQPAAAR